MGGSDFVGLAVSAFGWGSRWTQEWPFYLLVMSVRNAAEGVDLPVEGNADAEQRGVYANHDHVLAADVGDIADVVAEAAVAALTPERGSVALSRRARSWAR